MGKRGTLAMGCPSSYPVAEVLFYPGQKMAKKRDLHVLFPLGGLNRQGAYRQQPPYTSYDLSNVRPIATIEGRERGGSRPGLVESHITDLGANVRLLAPMVLALGDNFTAWSDTFAGTSLAAAWAQAAWAEDVPNILPEALASVDTSTSEGEVVRTALSIDSTSAYTVEMFLSPYEGAWHGKYRLYFRLDDTTPDITTEGVVVELTMTGTDGAYSATLTSYLAETDTEVDTATGATSAAIPGWLSATVDGNDVSVYWNGTEILSGTVDAHSGLRVGFGMECTVDGGMCLANVFRVQYYSTSVLTGARTVLVASASGDLWYESTYGSMTQVTTDLTLRDDVLLTAAQSGQDLYIADYGLAKSSNSGAVLAGVLFEDGVDFSEYGITTHDYVVVLTNTTGTLEEGTYKITLIEPDGLTLDPVPGVGNCSYRVERAPKVYDLSAGTLAIHTASTGQVPTGCPLICRHLGRLFMGGADIAPHVWYACRQNDEDDWDYSQADTQRAVAGTASEAGVPGTALTAFAPHSDDYLIMGCRDSVWRMRGDPAYGGRLDALSRTVGIIGAKAWCLGPAGELVFLSLDGLYILPPGGDSAPIPVSRNILPREFKNLNPETITALLEFDTADKGVHIFLSEESSNARTHWWFDWQRKTFWPLSLASSREPLTTCSYQSTAIEDSCVVLGCRDGKLRRFSALAETDCGTSFSSYAMMGPIPLGRDGQVGVVSTLVGVMASDSGDVTWSLHPANTFEAAATASASDSATWVAGLNAHVYPACRGQATMLKITGTAGRKWAFEQAIATVRESGRRRFA